jgi:hypothetical protein
VRSPLLLAYLAGQALAIIGSFFVPVESWLYVAWTVAVGWTGAAFVVVGVRRFRPAGAALWYLIAAGVLFNTAGLAVDRVLSRFFGIVDPPNLSDLFYLALYPGLITGLGWFVYRQSATEEREAMLLRTAACAALVMVLAVLAWEFIIWPQSDHRISVARRVMVAAYPLADLVLIALTLRLVLAGASRNAAFCLLVASLCLFLAADVSWAVFLRSGTDPSPRGEHLLEMASMCAQALVGGAAVHPAVGAITPPTEGPRVHLDAAAWTALAVSALTAPVVLLVHALLDYFWLAGSL